MLVLPMPPADTMCQCTGGCCTTITDEGLEEGWDEPPPLELEDSQELKRIIFPQEVVKVGSSRAIQCFNQYSGCPEAYQSGQGAVRFRLPNPFIRCNVLGEVLGYHRWPAAAYVDTRVLRLVRYTWSLEPGRTWQCDCSCGTLASASVAPQALDDENAARLEEIRGEWRRLLAETEARNQRKLEALRRNQVSHVKAVMLLALFSMLCIGTVPAVGQVKLNYMPTCLAYGTAAGRVLMSTSLGILSTCLPCFSCPCSHVQTHATL
jgi:hypothetical protein